ncbi:MAG TPA: alpha/beta hydrolase [Polyangiaceae bacterium]|nr:alpha/beta hydrolase [Polyangiaceae bacterium]
MKPMFFGDSKRKLYGVYDAPRSAQRRSHAVLLCYPGVQEYGTSLWGFRRLSAMLAQAGHHVLRFDYFGTGDSAGRSEEGSVSAWIEDIQQAAAELKDISGARQLSILGKRLGGALAIKACQAGLDAKRLVLWDPVVHGSAYVSELEMWDTRRNLLLLHADRRGGGRSELLGYPFPQTLRRELEALNVMGELPGAVKQVSLFVSEARDVHQRLHDLYVAAGITSELKRAADEGNEAGAQGRAQLSGSILTDMANGLAEVSAA